MNRLVPSCWTVIPVKAPGAGKTRLAGVLGPQSRAGLVRAMLERVVEAAHACGAVERVCLVGSSDYGLDGRVVLIEDKAEGLNEALCVALVDLSRSGSPADPRAGKQPCPERLIVIAGDLPQVVSADFALLADVPADAIAIAPDRHGTGTNAISLPLSAAAAYRFCFGPGSYALHRAEAERLGYNLETVLSDGLEKDIDEPADLADAEACLQDAL